MKSVSRVFVVLACLIGLSTGFAAENDGQDIQPDEYSDHSGTDQNDMDENNSDNHDDENSEDKLNDDMQEDVGSVGSFD